MAAEKRWQINKRNLEGLGNFENICAAATAPPTPSHAQMTNEANRRPNRLTIPQKRPLPLRLRPETQALLRPKRPAGFGPRRMRPMRQLLSLISP